MNVINRTKQALPSKMSAKEFGQAMSRLRLGEIPKEKRHDAIRDHMLRIMSGELLDPTERYVCGMSRMMWARRPVSGAVSEGEKIDYNPEVWDERSA